MQIKPKDTQSQTAWHSLPKDTQSHTPQHTLPQDTQAAHNKAPAHSLKNAVIIWIGLIFLLIDTRIKGIIFYPAFEEFDTPAPITVDMIIGHLIGDSVSIDIFSDFIGCLLIIIVCWRIVNENKKAFVTFLSSSLSLILYAAYVAMPFFLNGESRYQAGFFMFIIYALSETISVILAGFTCCEMAECMENHALNSVVAIFVMLSAFAGFISNMCYFYDFPRVSLIYFGAQTFFTLVYTIMYWKRRCYIRSGNGSKKEY